MRSAAARLGLSVDVIDLWKHPDEAARIDGIIFTGGGDVAPDRFGRADEIDRCEGIKLPRDDHEFRMCEIAAERALPTLGICRGEQLLNVHFGGTLITHMPTAREHVKRNHEDARHSITTVRGSAVAQLALGERADVNSSHHQAVDRLAEPFAVTARAGDGTIEAYEWSQPDGKPFLLAVQWHPERMNQTEPLAGPIFERFLKAVAGSRSDA
ncbi:MAG TPA: gamma-glutamyl-gamma-aminobutyrate hydrolase family protein [Candidatus Acidoferrales bacterium]|nr:gamma-glutamyl-gamma-aminobutyrate hydrolase family protein [Candidatus Acidoferrales bacterium]